MRQEAAAAGSTAAAGWLGKSCDTCVVRELRATPSGRQGRALASLCHYETYQPDWHLAYCGLVGVCVLLN